MPNHLRNWKFTDVQKFLKSHGFILHRVKGSHFHYKGHIGNKIRLVVVPYHGNKSIAIGTMSSIVRQSGIKKSAWTSQ